MKKLRYIIIAFLSLGLFSCSDYLEHNFNDQMTIEEVFSDLYDKYGEDFNWYMLPLTQADGMFVTELKNEIVAKIW